MHTVAALWGIQINTVISYCSNQTLLCKSLGTTLGAEVYGLQSSSHSCALTSHHFFPQGLKENKVICTLVHHLQRLGGKRIL